MNILPKVYLRPGKDEFVRRRHPWVFSGAIARIEGELSDGDLVEVCDKKGTPLGAGHFHHGSIAVRLISFDADDLNAPAFWEKKLQNALAVRQTTGVIGTANKHTNAFRLVHGEGDGLSGLVVDIYGTTAVVQCHSIGMHRQREQICSALQQVLGKNIDAVYDKSMEALPPNYAQNIQNGYLFSAAQPPESSSAIILENDVQFKIDWETGQKTGFFLDQRDNRALLGKYAPGKSVLNTFCYTGGFSCYALKAGAAMVHSVDVSAKAMELTEQNVALNTTDMERHQSHTADVLNFLKISEEQYDILVVDPPAFAKSMEKRHNAVQGYKRLNEMALRRVKPGGIMFTFSCSQVVDRELFYHTIAAAAMEVGREVRVLHHLTQGADHPVSMFHPEGSYLKGLVLHVN